MLVFFHFYDNFLGSFLSRNEGTFKKFKTLLVDWMFCLSLRKYGENWYREEGTFSYFLCSIT